MKKSTLILTILILISSFLYSTTSLSKLALSKIKTELESDTSYEKENPFTARDFRPYLDGKWIGNAISYGCYRKGQEPGVKGPSESEILEDIRIISKHWNLIRVYNADDDTERILKVIQENNIPVKMMLGVWLENEEKNQNTKQSNINNTIRAIDLYQKYPEIIMAINVGNETQVYWSWHRMNTSNLIKYIRTIRKYTEIPVTTADDYNFWNKPESEKVANEIDFIVTHIYPLWNSQKLQNSIPWLDENFDIVKKTHPEKTIVLGEIGWATNYNPDKKGPGEQGTLIKGKTDVETQGKFLIKLKKWINRTKTTTFIFEAFDESWKGGGENSGLNEIEKNWGLFYENRTPKQSFINYLKHKKKEINNREEL